MARKPAAHKKMMKMKPHKDPKKGTKAYKKHERKESGAMEALERRLGDKEL